VGTDGVIGKVEVPRQLLDSAGRAAQKGNDLPARTIEKPFIEGDSFHPQLILANFHRKHKKSNKFLTY
jgi:hypothetical protein